MNVLEETQAVELLAAARAAAVHAHVPYSAFPVGAAILTPDGTIVTGCNVENASFGLTVCAERVAAFTAVAMGHREFRAIAMVAIQATGATPCGACRQVLNEFAPRDGSLAVVITAPDHFEMTTLAALLPRSFGPEDLQGTSG